MWEYLYKIVFLFNSNFIVIIYIYEFRRKERYTWAFNKDVHNLINLRETPTIYYLLYLLTYIFDIIKL